MDIGTASLMGAFPQAAQGSTSANPGLSGNFDFSGIDLGGINISEFGQQIMEQISKFLGPLLEQIQSAFSGLSEGGLDGLSGIFQRAASDTTSPAADVTAQADMAQTQQRVATVSGLAGGPTT